MDKAYILQEIRRTAESNGGVPLGWRKFASETGIKRSDWHKKIWAGWADAVREAGFAPNPISSRYDTTVLLEKYAALVRELGRLPTSDNLSLKAIEPQKANATYACERRVVLAAFFGFGKLRSLCGVALAF